MPNLPLNPVILISILASAGAIILYLREYNLRKKLESEGDKFLKEIREKSWETLNQSVKKSQTILEEAELEGIKVAAGSKININKFEADFSAQLNQYLIESRQVIASAQERLLEFMQDLQTRSEQFETARKSAGEQRINQVFDRIEGRLSDFLVQTEQNTTNAIELEMKATRQFIDTYKTRQLRLIDENIIAMMEQTLNIVLGKKLSLKDQLDLVYEALEKAKIEKFIV